MSLDVYLEGAPSTAPGTGIFVRDNGTTRELTRAEWDERYPGHEPVIAAPGQDECWSANITHNLGRMADAAGLYKLLWRPDELRIQTAAGLIPQMEEGLRRLEQYPEAFRQLNPDNGWGNYEALVKFVRAYLAACEANPEARVRVCR